MRTFISIDMPENVKREIKKIQNLLPVFIGKKTERENLHLTLKFLGKIDGLKMLEVKKKLREIKLNKFEVEVNLIGVFSEKFVRIVWLYLKGCDELQKQVDEKLKDLFESEKRFMSHLTIARVKTCDRKKFLKGLQKIKMPKIKFEVKNFYLKQSILTKKGLKYKTIEKYFLI